MAKAVGNGQKSLSRALTPLMVVLSLVFLALLALLVPASLTEGPRLLGEGGWWPVLWAVVTLWLFFVAEFLVLLVFCPPSERSLKYQLNALLAALIPPLRMGGRVVSGDPWVWLPLKGWNKVNLALSEGLAKRFYGPMALIALLVVPLLAIEYLAPELVVQEAWLVWVLDLGYRLVWFAFALEFAVRVSIAPNKLGYCKQHLIDLVIVVLPLVAFLRVLRVLAGVARLEQLSRMGRVYRLRGGFTKALRALVFLKLFQRSSLKALRKARVKLQAELAEKLQEVRLLECRLQEVEARLETLKSRGVVSETVGGLPAGLGH